MHAETQQERLSRMPTVIRVQGGASDDAEMLVRDIPIDSVPK